MSALQKLTAQLLTGMIEVIFLFYVFKDWLKSITALPGDEKVCNILLTRRELKVWVVSFPSEETWTIEHVPQILPLSNGELQEAI